MLRTSAEDRRNYPHPQTKTQSCCSWQSMPVNSKPSQPNSAVLGKHFFRIEAMHSKFGSLITIITIIVLIPLITTITLIKIYVTAQKQLLITWTVSPAFITCHGTIPLPTNSHTTSGSHLQPPFYCSSKRVKSYFACCKEWFQYLQRDYWQRPKDIFNQQYIKDWVPGVKSGSGPRKHKTSINKQ